MLHRAVLVLSCAGAILCCPVLYIVRTSRVFVCSRAYRPPGDTLTFVYDECLKITAAAMQTGPAA